MLDEFKELIGQSKDIFHKTFKYKDTNTYKNQKGDKNEHKNCPSTMARIKATVIRLNRPTFVAALGQRIGNKNIMNRKHSMFKIKTHLSRTVQVEVKKHGQVVRRMRVRRKSVE